MAAGIWKVVFLGVLSIAAWQDKKELSISRTFLIWSGIFAVLGRILTADRAISLLEWGLSLLPGIIFIGLGWLSKWQIGIGDGIIILIMGLWLGIRETVAVLLMGMFLCSIVCGGLLLARKAGRKTKVPFVPFLWVAYLIGRVLG